MTDPLGRTGIVVGVADMKTGGAADRQLVTYALGSCIGLTAYDPVARVGGLLHFMLPQPSARSEIEQLKQFMYATTGIPMLLRRLQERGALQARLVMCAAGGAEILEGAASMAIGKRNRTMLRKVLWKMNLSLAAEDTGGSLARTMTLDLATGAVGVRARSSNSVLWQPGLTPAPIAPGSVRS
ncbi:MAG: chemotaxis protein CheD [Planctomycetes bacterium]|nr:chemotaxis protein CheD [Planctomycetota bacterium]